MNEDSFLLCTRVFNVGKFGEYVYEKRMFVCFCGFKGLTNANIEGFICSGIFSVMMDDAIIIIF